MSWDEIFDELEEKEDFLERSECVWNRFKTYEQQAGIFHEPQALRERNRK
jgi:hypothetical protein